MMSSSSKVAPPASKSLAIRRLQQDLKELQLSPPLPVTHCRSGGWWGVKAQPREANLFVWDVEMIAASGPLRARSIRMTMTFNENYPATPPDVKLLTPIDSHPNVFGDWICLDMLKDPEQYSTPYQGWSAAYRVSGVLLQLYGFLLVDDTIGQMYGNRVVQRKGATGKRAGMHHEMREQQLKALLDLKSDQQDVPAAQEAPVEPLLERLDDHLLRKVLQCLGPLELLNCMATTPSRLARVATDVKQRGDLQCFYSKRDYTEAVLGFGVHREWHAGRRSGELRGLVVRLDYLSLNTFVTAGVRRSAWNAPMDAFLPLYLNPEHGQRSLQALPGCIAHIASKNAPLPTPTGSGQADAPFVQPRQLLTVLAQAMNSLVVEMVRLDKGEVPTHMSDAALKGFAHLHHLLLAVALGPKGASLVSEARRDVEAFISGGEGGRARHKTACPDLGVLLVELMLVPKEEVSWQRFLPPFLRELLSRQVRWALQPDQNRNAPPSNPNADAAGNFAGMAGCNCHQCVAARARAAAAAAARASMRGSSSGSGGSSSGGGSGSGSSGGGRFEFGVVAGEDLRGDSHHSFQRMRVQYESAVTGLRNVQLICWFGLELARPQTAAGVMLELQVVKRAYDECSGAPAPEALAAFHAHALTVMAAGSWGAALGGLRASLRCALPPAQPDPRGVWVAALRQAVVDSWVSGYHNTPNPWGRGPPVRVQGSYRAPPPPPPVMAAPPRPAAAAAATKDGWKEVARKEAVKPQGGGRGRRPQQGLWSNLFVCEPERLRAVQMAFGVPFVDWEGEAKPVAASPGA